MNKIASQAKPNQIPYTVIDLVEIADRNPNHFTTSVNATVEKSDECLLIFKRQYRREFVRITSCAKRLV